MRFGSCTRSGFIWCRALNIGTCSISCTPRPAADASGPVPPRATRRAVGPGMRHAGNEIRRCRPRGRHTSGAVAQPSISKGHHRSCSLAREHFDTAHFRPLSPVLHASWGLPRCRKTYRRSRFRACPTISGSDRHFCLPLEISDTQILARRLAKYMRQNIGIFEVARPDQTIRPNSPRSVRHDP